MDDCLFMGAIRVHSWFKLSPHPPQPSFDPDAQIGYEPSVNRLLIFIGASALIVIASWAARRHPEPARVSQPGETPSCCHPAPSRAAMLKAK